MPDNIGDAAWDFLYPFLVRHPYADDFVESVTNWIRWFDPKNPEPAIVQREDTGEWNLLLNSKGGRRADSLELAKGKRMVIPLNRQRHLEEINRQIRLCRDNPPFFIGEAPFPGTGAIAILVVLAVFAAAGVAWWLIR